jgi:hypothetical protein
MMAQYNKETDGISLKLANITLLKKRDVNINPFQKGLDEVSFVLITTDGQDYRVESSSSYYQMEKEATLKLDRGMYYSRTPLDGTGPVAYDALFFEVQQNRNFGTTISKTLQSQGKVIAGLVGTVNPAVGVVIGIAAEITRIVIGALNGPKQIAHISGSLEYNSKNAYNTVTSRWSQTANAIKATFVSSCVEDMVTPAATHGGLRGVAQPESRRAVRAVR